MEIKLRVYNFYDLKAEKTEIRKETDEVERAVLQKMNPKMALPGNGGGRGEG